MGKDKRPHLPICCMRRCRQCGTSSDENQFRSFEEIVSDYIKKWRPEAEKEFLLFKNLETLETAVEFAGLAECPRGRKFDHQHRIPPKILEKSKSILSQLIPQIHNCRDFDELFKLVEEKIGKISGIGELTVYDTALRIGTNLGVEPKLVYLHCGTRDGAKALEKVWEINIKGRNSLNRSELPGAFSKLSYREIEDCLCIYKKYFKNIIEATSSPL